ncbi:NAD(P)H-dependent oxidoreductase [Pediococcus acidilactici]|nr:NAD(P)H-dependent oxidoreductase [Pediococcus acidilactici]
MIFAAPEHNHAIPAALKKLIKWFSFKLPDGKSIRVTV